MNKKRNKINRIIMPYLIFLMLLASCTSPQNNNIENVIEVIIETPMVAHESTSISITPTLQPTAPPIALLETKVVSDILPLDLPITLEEITKFSMEIGIEDWSITENKQSHINVCSYYEGKSWSTYKNLAANCIFDRSSASQNTLEIFIEQMFDTEWNDAEKFQIGSSIELEGVHALFVGYAPNGQTVFDVLVVDGGDFAYWASITIATQPDAQGMAITPDVLYEMQSEVINQFLESVINTNIERVKVSLDE